MKSGYFKGVGGKKAELLVKEFGEDLLYTVERTPNELTYVSGISDKIAKDINTSFLNIKTMSNAIMFFKQFDLSNNAIDRIYDQYGFNAEKLVKEDPYRLIREVDGIGFSKADEIASSMGIEELSTERFKAGMLKIIEDRINYRGDTIVYDEVLYESMGALLNKPLISTKQLASDLAEIYSGYLVKELADSFPGQEETINLISDVATRNVRNLIAGKKPPLQKYIKAQLKKVLDENGYKQNSKKFINAVSVVNKASKLIADITALKLADEKKTNDEIKELNKEYIKTNWGLVKKAGNELRREKQLRHDVDLLDDNKRTYVALQKHYDIEKHIASRLVELSKKQPKKISTANFDRVITAYETKNKITLNTEQKSAIESALNNNVSIITGGPGTGKTTILKAVIEALKSTGKSYVLTAPTGKAAKRMSEAIGTKVKTQTELFEEKRGQLQAEIMRGERAGTIHMALGVNGKNAKERFKHNKNNKFKTDAIIIDEASMVDIDLMSNLLKAIKDDTKLIIVGDADQLSSISAGNLLTDIIASKVIPTTRLTEIYRQAKDSGIIENSSSINKGILPDLTQDEFKNDKEFNITKAKGQEDIANKTIDTVMSIVPKLKNVTPQEVNVLTPFLKGEAGVHKLNERLQEAINAPDASKNQIEINETIYREGDKVIQVRTNYDKKWHKFTDNGIEHGLIITNGEEGIIESIDTDKKIIQVAFEDGKKSAYRENYGQLQLAYAKTIHKAQGSEHKYVALALGGGNPFSVTRKLAYTGVTRASQFVNMIVNGRDLFRQVVLRDEKRNTMLQGLLEKEASKEAVPVMN